MPLSTSFRPWWLWRSKITSKLVTVVHFRLSSALRLRSIALRSGFWTMGEVAMLETLIGFSLIVIYVHHGVLFYVRVLLWTIMLRDDRVIFSGSSSQSLTKPGLDSATV